MKSVFISSVIQGFVKYRAAAKIAVTSLQMRPVMAEDFGAKPYSPQTACLEAVRSSDVYVGLLGARYGRTRASGTSATEEEFDEARRRGIPILLFVERTDRDADQEEFLRRIREYEIGYVTAEFGDAAELTAAICGAVFPFAGSGAGALSSEAARERLRGCLVALVHEGRESSVGVALTPARAGDFLPIDALEADETKTKVLKLALFGTPPCFATEYSTKTRTDRQRLVMEQHDARALLAHAVHVYTDGTVACRCRIDEADPRPWSRGSFVRTHVIDESQVTQLLASALALGDSVLRLSPSPHLLDSLYLLMAIYNAGGKYFGRIPEQSVESISLAMAEVENPLTIPEEPLRLPGPELADSQACAERLVRHIAREFRARDLYYSPSA